MSQTFDIYSYIASLQGSLALVQQQIAKNQATLSTASTQAPITYQQFNNAVQVGNNMPNGASTDQQNIINALSNSYDSLENQITNTKSQIASLNDQQNSLNAQIKAAQDTANSIPRTTPSVPNPTPSSPGINLSSLKLPNLSNVSPVFLVAGAALLILILK